MCKSVTIVCFSNCNGLILNSTNYFINRLCKYTFILKFFYLICAKYGQTASSHFITRK